ncbi:MAG: HAD-IA family hydrolase [Candidatus Gastranaerophilales bacterium]|nr:HAD-IA family hydrolase [Candidatus Gastranaerophilales bacterium]
MSKVSINIPCFKQAKYDEKLNFLETLFSLKNVYINGVKRKVINIFGVKIKLYKNTNIKKARFYVNNIDKIRTKIKENIKSPSIEFVSFDIFDTLLVRPCINPTDIFALIAEKVDKKYNIDFFNMRKNAENGIVNATIYDIYNAIKEHYNISEELKNILLKEEIAAEMQLLYVREDTKEFYELALQENKKIIAISDMYLSSDILLNILKAKGFSKIEKVFVSNEYQARKSNGELFDCVINEIKTNKIFHIGDNIISDYKMPLAKGIKAGYCPKIIDILSSYNVILENLLTTIEFSDNVNAGKNVFIGFVLNNYWFNLSVNNSKLFNSLKDFANLFLAPYLCYISFLLQNNTLIQNTYKKIYFVSRDGFLPNKIYNILNNGKFIQGEYIYGSRVAYWTGLYSSIYDLIRQQQCYFSGSYTLGDFLNAYIADEKLNAYLKTKYSENDLKITVKDNLPKCLILLQQEDENFAKYYTQQKALAEKYYEDLFKDESSRIVVFDVGYSGSISLGLSKLTQKSIDKIYVRETPANIFRDNRNQTYTYILKNGIDSNLYANLDLLLEECFSPLEGTCTGFSKNGNNIVPLLDKITIPSEMKFAHKEINDCCENFTKKLINLFGEYIEYLNITDINILFDCLNNNLRNNPDEKDIFKDIVYSDTATLHTQVSLKEKIK